MLSLDSINRAEVLRYMGFRGNAPDKSFTQRIDALEQELIKAAVPRLVWRMEELVRCERGLYAGGLRLSGRDIEAHLDGCSHAVIMAATLSIEADRLIDRAQSRSLADALALDALGSAGIEQICGKAEDIIKNQLPEKYMTWRFSPGYGDFPIDIQKSLADILDAGRRIGLTVTDSCLMIPRKSVTAVIGVSDRPLPEKRRGCLYCKMRDKCNFRKNGVRCTDA